MIDHLSIGVSDIAASIAFYDAVLAPLGYVRLWTHHDAAGYGRPGERDEPFALKHESLGRPASSRRSHIAWSATSHDAVRAFHTAALAHGAQDEGAAGFHAEYGPQYFAAFVADPDGYRLEAVCHDPQGGAAMATASAAKAPA